MITQKLREMLDRCASRPAKPRGCPPRCTLIVGKRMTPRGCECAVSLTSRRREEWKQRRVVLSGVGPGDVLRAPARCFEAIARERRPPRADQCDLWLGRAWGKARALPCPHTAHCARCPWMALSPAHAREIKAERLRRVLEPLLVPGWPRRFLEPFAVPVAARAMREAEFAFALPQPGPQGVLPGEFFFASRDLPGALDCALWTLEQQRLLTALNRWAAGVSPIIQRCLRAVFVLQHGENHSQRSWEAPLHVTLLLRRDVVSLGEQNPLCGPSQPEGLLSLEEQRLVDAVMSTAHLMKRVGIATVCDNGTARVLYPHAQQANCSTAAVELIRSETIHCTALHGPSGRALTAVLPFVHSALATTIGARDITPLEEPMPSLWRHTMALESVGSVVLSLLHEMPTGCVVLCAEFWTGGAAVPQTSASRLLATAMAGWLNNTSASVLRVAKATHGESGVVSAGDFTAADSVSLCICLISDSADVDASLAVLRKSFAMASPPRGILLLQTTAEGEFDLLAVLFSGAKEILQSRGISVSFDGGVVDVDSWTAAVVGYVLLEVTPHPHPQPSAPSSPAASL